MAQNKHKTKRRIICILCASIIALYALAIPIGAVTNSSQTTSGSTALYGVSPFPYTVGFVLNDEITDRNYIFATEVGGYGLANNETTSGDDTFEWHYPDSTDTNMSSISYSNVDETWLENTLHWYANRSIDYGSNYGNFYGGFGQMTLLYQSLDSGFFPSTESLVFKSNSVVYNTIWATDQMTINTFAYLENPTPIEYMMPAVILPTFEDNTKQAYVGAYSVQVLITDAFGNSEWHQYSVPIDTRGTDAQPIPFIDYDVIKQYIKLNGGILDEEETSKTILIEEYRGFLDVDYYEYIEPEVDIVGTWIFNDGISTSGIANNTVFNIDCTFSSSSLTEFDAGNTDSTDYILINGQYTGAFYAWSNNIGSSTTNICAWYTSDEGWRLRNSASGSYVRETPFIHIYGGSDVTNEVFINFLQSNATYSPSGGSGNSLALAEEGTWEIIDDADKLNTINITFPMYNTSGGEGVSAGAQSLFSFPTADKYAIERVSNIDVSPTIPSYDEIPEDMYKDYSDWLGNGVAGFFSAQIFPGISLGGIVGVMVMFGCAIALLKIFAGG